MSSAGVLPFCCIFSFDVSVDVVQYYCRFPASHKAFGSIPQLGHVIKKKLSNGYKAHLHQDKYFVKQQIDFYHSLNSKHIQSNLIFCVGLSLHEIKQTYFM